MAIVLWLMWISIGVVIYIFEMLYRILIMRTNVDKNINPEAIIIYGCFGVVSILFFLYTVLVHIQRIQENRKRKL